MQRFLFFVMALALTAGTPGFSRAEGGGANLVFTSYRPGSPLSGALYAYIENRGDVPAEIEKITIDGSDMPALREQGVVSWFRVRPETIMPGKMAEVLVRFETFPRELAARIAEEFLFHGESSGEVSLEVSLSTGERLAEKVTVSPAPEPMQINFIGFGPDLKTLYVYMQNNRWMLEDDRTPYNIDRVLVNGLDVTRRTRFAQRRLEHTVVPLEVSLPEPLEWGAPAVVAVSSAEGVSTGLTLRAFPSEFHVQVCFFDQIRRDAVRDVYNHNFSAISGRVHEHHVEAKARGLDSFLFGGGVRRLQAMWKPEYPEIKGQWLDEMDRRPAQDSWEIIKRAKDFYKPEGRFVPPFTLNIMSPSTPVGRNYLEIGDAITHGYGMDGGGWEERTSRDTILCTTGNTGLRAGLSILISGTLNTASRWTRNPTG